MTPAQLLILKAELTTDPKGLGLAAMTDEQAADALNLVRGTETVEREIIQTWEIVNATDKTDYTAMTPTDRQLYQIVVSAGEVNVKASQIRQIIGGLFPAGTATRNNLLALQTRPATRAEVLGLPAVFYWDVAAALGH